MGKIQRLEVEPYYDIHPSPVGDFYRAADVDALLARIRAAVDAEREETYTTMDYGPARAALDALLSQGVTDG